MKILIITPYITTCLHPAFLHNQTGFGYMVHDIAQYVAKDETVDMFAAMVWSPEVDIDGFRILKHTKWSFAKGLKLKNLVDGIDFNRKYWQPLVSSLRSLYIFASLGQIESIVMDYDVVHIHGCSELTAAAIKVCKRKGVPFLVTLHGLNSFGDSIKQNIALRRYERDFLTEAATNNYNVSFISTGNKKTVESFVGCHPANFSLICNGCDTQKRPITANIRKIYSIDSDNFLFACVGNVSVNKNQIQVAKAWNLLPNELRGKCKILFVGRYKEDDDVVRYITDNHLEDNLILCGTQSKDKLASYYSACDATILASRAEGFGLSIIEGFVYGKPNVTFYDLPAVPDIYDEKVMILAKERTDKALAGAMAEMIQIDFEEEYISDYAQKYSFKKMSEQYVKLYKQITV